MKCDQCGYDYSALPRHSLPSALIAEVDELLTELAAVESMTTRPAPDVWSAHEYACHVRDVLEWQDKRVKLAQVEDVPALQPMGREERVAGYADVDPAAVPAAIRAHADALSTTLRDLDDSGWDRRALYNYPTKTERSVEWIAAHTIHEIVHHGQDIAAVGAGRIPG